MPRRRRSPRGAAGAQAPIAVLDTGAGRRPATTRSTATATRRRRPTPARPRAARRAARRSPAIVTAAGERALPIRVAGYGSTAARRSTARPTRCSPGSSGRSTRTATAPSTTRCAVALVGVNAPYAGFGDSPEAQAVRGAAQLGTLVVAPAGNEGPARPPNGVVGSPGAARSALAAGATEAGAGVPRVDVTIGGARARAAPRCSAARRRRAAARRAGRRAPTRRRCSRGRPRAGRPRRARPRRRQPGRPGRRRGRRGRPRGPPRRPPRPPAADDARRPRRPRPSSA